jgi:hypothetical protein
MDCSKMEIGKVHLRNLAGYGLRIIKKLLIFIATPGLLVQYINIGQKSAPRL